MMNAMGGDLLNVGLDVLEASIYKGTLSIDGIHGRIPCQLERLQLHCLG